MKTMKWLLRREFWENKGSLYWAPIIVAGIMLLIFGGAMVYGLTSHGISAQFAGQELHGAAFFNKLPAARKAEIINGIASGFLTFSAPLFAMLSFTTFFYCLGALYNERSDRSILFWKSLPASDQMTVLSKVLTATCVAPLITIAVGTVMSFVLLMFFCVAFATQGINILLPVLASSKLYLAPLHLIGLLPVYVVWALPTIGWLLLVSSWARSKAFVWAVGAPLVAIAIVRLVDFLLGDTLHLDWFPREVVARGLGGLTPGIWFMLDHSVWDAAAHRGQFNTGAIISQSWMTLYNVGVWGAAAAGVLMIAVATRLRRWRDEG
ncbi:hypothetical protein [Massilia horti]|uniref:ABC-2 type transport system permease protein n=1 Tax=Massilia horti TaxID=2562153 RepID=A0A4Y9SZY2_9BURK|nr:hypothetical protein [Massilia horti]TFW32351.1 hypothetical protein E4O92_10315 [Massilia horti]